MSVIIFCVALVTSSQLNYILAAIGVFFFLRTYDYLFRLYGVVVVYSGGAVQAVTAYS